MVSQKEINKSGILSEFEREGENSFRYDEFLGVSNTSREF